MQKGCFTAVVFSSSSFFFSMPNLGGHCMDLNQTCTHIHLWLLFEKFGPESTGHLPPRAGGKKTFFGDRLWTLTEHISATEQDINNQKETCQSRGTIPYMPPKFGEFLSTNGWERLSSFCPPPKFSHWETLPALPHGRYVTDSVQALARDM